MHQIDPMKRERATAVLLDFLATWVVLDFSKEVPKIFLFSEISILCDKNPLKRP